MNQYYAQAPKQYFLPLAPTHELNASADEHLVFFSSFKDGKQGRTEIDSKEVDLVSK
jgi:hypothetical protein